MFQFMVFYVIHFFLAVFMYLSERYLEMLQSAEVEEPKSSQHKNGNKKSKSHSTGSGF